MRLEHWLCIFLLATVCGCAHSKEKMRFSRGRGDLGAFIIEQALARGAKPISTNELPRITERWKFAEDEYGVVVQAPKEQFDAVASFLRKAFGIPSLGPNETPDGGKFGVYSRKDIGIGLEFFSDKKRTQIIIVRPLNWQEVHRTVYETLKALAKTKEQKKAFEEAEKVVKDFESNREKK